MNIPATDIVIGDQIRTEALGLVTVIHVDRFSNGKAEVWVQTPTGGRIRATFSGTVKIEES